MSFGLRASSAAFVLALATAATATEVIDLGGGWEAVVQDTEFLDLVTDFVSIEDDLLVIGKFANFTGLDDITGNPAPLNITFRQVASDANTVSRIVITDETVLNNTGLDWNGFHMTLMGSVANFDAVASQTFSFSPFTSMDFSPDGSTVTFGGGTIADGDGWYPGIASGGLWIDVDLSGDMPANFVLREVATVPAPSVLALLALGLVADRRRR